MIELGAKFTLAYFLGSVLGGILIGRLRGIDLRTLGSRNPGSTNALRTQGKLFALLVLVIDVGKGILAVALIPALALPGVGLDESVAREVVLYAVAFGAILGHVFPFWLDFRGGKGAATAVGILFFLAPVLALPVLLLWLAVVLLSGYVGLATMSAALAAAVYAGVRGLPQDPYFFVFTCLVAALIVYAHRGNIQRMWNGTESRFRHSLFSK
jgi:acyl phosphate:glycerol-3-phosphate acyltransferase